MEREAFARAWKFLRFKPVAKTTAFVTAVTSGILYVLLLIVLGLFADLMVNRGKIPAYRDMPLPDREAFLQQWQDLPIETRRQPADRHGHRQPAGHGVSPLSAVRQGRPLTKTTAPAVWEHRAFA